MYDELAEKARACGIACAAENTIGVVRADVTGRTTTHACEGTTGVVASIGTAVCTTQRFAEELLTADRSSPGGAATRNGTPNVTLLCATSIEPRCRRIERFAMNAQNVSITLIGPGGAGKSTVGVLIAKRLGMAFVDLDQRFVTRAGDISEYIDRFGYTAYARENVETYDWLLREGGRSVAALSSGFMTYPRDIHPQYARLRQSIEENPMTFMLIPSLNRDICVAETVRRQLARPFARSAGREEVVIRERFPIYVGLRARKIETMRPVTAVVNELLMAIRSGSEPRPAR
jgi:shikimate kinase